MKIIAHRGNGSNKYTENTMDAFIWCFNNHKIDGIELDVRITKDYKFVINHNSFISFNSDGKGLIKNKTLKELKKYNFGNKNNPSKICTLKDVLKKAPKDKLIFIELKDDNLTDKYINAFYKVIKPFINKKLYIFSFNIRLIQKLNKKYPNLKVGYCMNKLINDKYINNFSFQLISLSLINEISNHIENYFWTINNKKDFLKIKTKLKNKYYGIITDKPNLIFDLLE